jgi:hypothetical protein
MAPPVSSAGSGPADGSAREVIRSCAIHRVQSRRVPALTGQIKVSVAMANPLRTALAMGGTGQLLNLHLHQALGSRRSFRAANRRRSSFFQKLTKGHDLVGHRWILGSVADSMTKPYR